MPSSITLCYTPTHALNRMVISMVSNHSHPALFVVDGRLAAPDFVMKCIEARAFRWPEVCKFYGVSYLIALSDWRSK